jgi:hypothetical protein
VRHGPLGGRGAVVRRVDLDAAVVTTRYAAVEPAAPVGEDATIRSAAVD